ncbi:MAG: FG-GAP-like repeat-containing protein [Planctomycetota bacterium]
MSVAFRLGLLTLVAAAVPASAQDGDAGAGREFAAPVRIVAAGKYVGSSRSVRNPVATYVDIDHDGTRELVVGDEWGFLYVHDPVLEEGEPRFGRARQPVVDGESLRFANDGSFGVFPQFVDFDGDGREDLLAATYEGAVFVAYATEDGYRRPERVRDSKDRPVQLARAFDPVEGVWKDRDGVVATESLPEEHAVAAIAVDWDEDGDLDLLLASQEGRFFVQRDAGGGSPHAFTGTSDPLLVNTLRGLRPLRVPNGVTSIRALDWDGDGLFDLVCGSRDGGVLYFRNTGEKGRPDFARSTVLVQDMSTTRDVPGAEPTAPENRLYAETVDWDGDGDVDLLVSGATRVVPLPRELSEEEAARADELALRVGELERSVRDIYRAAVKSDTGVLTPEQERRVLELRRELKDVRDELQELRPEAVDVDYVWLYRRL